MTRKLVELSATLKNERGEFVKPSSPEPFVSDLNIDNMMQRGLAALDRLMRVITQDISTGNPSRETVMNLKDAMSMLETLKKRESELLEHMSEEDLLKAVK